MIWGVTKVLFNILMILLLSGMAVITLTLICVIMKCMLSYRDEEDVGKDDEVHGQTGS